MDCIVLKVSEWKKSKHTGRYKRAVLKDIKSGRELLFDCYESHTSSKRFLPYLKPQAILSQIESFIKNKKEFVNGYSNFIYKGQRHPDVTEAVSS